MSENSPSTGSSLLDCGLCKSRLRDPRTLPCLHLFCLKCLEAYASSKQPRDRMMCPVCRSCFDIPDKGVVELQTNCFVEKLLKAEQDARVFQSGVAVELCDCCSDETNTDVGHAVKIDVAKWYCLPCKKNLCPSCRIRHMNSESQTAHHLVESSARHNQQPPARQPNHCPTHPDRDIVVFCRDCSVVICEQCFTEQHGGHTWSDVETAAEEFRQRIQQDIDKVQEHLKMGQNRMRALEMQRKRLEDLDDIERIINLKSEELKALVDNDTNRLLMSLEEVKKRATDVPSDQLTAETPGEGSEEGLEERQVLDGLQMLDFNDLIPINLTFTASQLGADDQNLIGRLVTLEESEIPPTDDVAEQQEEDNVNSGLHKKRTGPEG